MGYKLQLILKSMLQAPAAWNTLLPIPNAEADSMIDACWCWKTILTDLMEEKRKYCGTTLYIFTHSQIRNVFC
jgi:hypothetical protein